MWSPCWGSHQEGRGSWWQYDHLAGKEGSGGIVIILMEAREEEADGIMITSLEKRELVALGSPCWGRGSDVITLLGKRSWWHCDHLAGKGAGGIVITLLSKR